MTVKSEELSRLCRCCILLGSPCYRVSINPSLSRWAGVNEIKFIQHYTPVWSRSFFTLRIESVHCIMLCNHIDRGPHRRPSWHFIHQVVPWTKRILRYDVCFIIEAKDFLFCPAMIDGYLAGWSRSLYSALSDSFWTGNFCHAFFPFLSSLFSL